MFFLFVHIEMKIPVQQIPFNVYQIHEQIFNTFKSNLTSIAIPHTLRKV